jgi:hypothetical protein
VLAPIEPEYRLFTHLLDGSGERLMTLDAVGPLRELTDGKPAFPPEAWEVGKVYVDQQVLRAPKGIETSRVQFVTGLARGEERLPIVSGPKDTSGRAVVTSLPVAQSRQRVKKRAVPTIAAPKRARAETITIDGVAEEPAWRRAPVLELTGVATGERDTKSPVQGTVKLLWDDLGLYLAFDVQDGNVTGGFAKTDRDPHLWTRDTVEIMIDPDGDGDNRDYYEIQIGPQNLVFDSAFDEYNQPRKEPDGPFGHQEWSSRVSSAALVRGTIDQPEDRDQGYTIEAVLPWKSFTRAQRAPPSIGDEWRLNFYAIQENSGVAWSPILNEGNFHKAARFGRVTFLGDSVGKEAPRLTE